MLQVATLEVISVAAAVLTQTTTTMAHAGRTLELKKILTCAQLLRCIPSNRNVENEERFCHINQIV